MGFRDFSAATLSRRSMLRGGAFVAAGSAFASLPFGARLGAHDVSAEWPNIAAAIESYVNSGKLANMVACLGWAQEKPHMVARGALGFGAATPADLDSLYRWYSMTKPITGIATMMCIEDGLLGLDQPLAEVIEEFAEMRVLVDPLGPLDNTVPAERPITIRHLLTHTAGLGYDITVKGPLLAEYRRLGLTSGQLSRFPIPGIPKVESAPGLAAFAKRLATVPLIAQPGTRWHYSASLDLLGRVIEVVSKMRFDQFLKTRLFEPLGMTSTYFQVPRSEIARLTDNYGIVGGTPLPADPAMASIFLDPPPILWGGSGLVGSPADYDRFLRMLLGYGKVDGKRVMGELAVRVGTSNLLPEGAETKNSWIAGQGFGAGGRVDGKVFGWGGAAGTLAAVDFGHDLRAGLFTQYMPAESYPVRDRFLKALGADLAARAAHG